MKLEKIEKNTLLEALDDFREGKSPVDDLEFNDKITVEMPYFSAKAIKDIQERDAKLKKILEPVDKAAEELLKDTEAQKAKSEKESKSFKLSESYLKENFENRWSKNENTYTVKCNGRKDLRTLIAEAKAQGIKYKFNKLLDEDYKYDFIYTIEGGLQPVEETLEEDKKEKEICSECGKEPCECKKDSKEEPILKEDYYDYEEEERDGEKDDEYLLIPGSRYGYGIDQVEDVTCTVGQLIEALSEYDENTKVLLANDNEYTYGYIDPKEWYRKVIVDSKEELDEALFNPQAHKVIVDKYYSKDNDDSKDIVYIILPRQKVFVKLTRKEMFDKNLHYGTFIDQVPVNTETASVEEYANNIINRLGAKEVSTDELISIENKTKDQDTAQAFAHAEKSFREELDEEKIDADYERSYGPAPDKEEDPEGYTKYIDAYHKWLKNGESFDNLEEKLTEAIEEKSDESLNEAFNVIGNLTNYTPWGNAVELWETIKGANKEEEFDSILTDLYPEGLSLNELNDFLSTKEGIIRTLLDLETVEPVEETKEVEVEEEPISEEEFEAEDDNIEDIEELVKDEPIQDTTEEERAANREKFLNTETGFEEEDEDDASDIASLV